MVPPAQAATAKPIEIPKPVAKPADPHPACANISPSDPADQCLHNKIEWENRWQANIWGGYSPGTKTFSGGLAYEPTLAHWGVRLEGAYAPELKKGGARLKTSLTLPINEKLSLHVPIGTGFSVDTSGGRTWLTFEGSAGAYLRWQPHKYVRISAGAEFLARYRWSPNEDKWNEDVAMTQKAGADYKAQIQKRVDQFGRDVDAQMATLSDAERAAFKTAMDSYLTALRNNALNVATAALTPSRSDDNAAQTAMQNAADAALGQLDAQTQQNLAATKAFLGARINQLVSEVKGDTEKAWDDYKSQFKLPFDDGGGGNVKIEARVDAMYPLVESKEKNGGGVWTIGGIGITGNVPVSFGLGHDAPLLPTDMNPTKPGVRFSPYLGFRGQIPGTTIGAELTGTWSPTLSGKDWDLKNATIMFSPYIRF